MQLAKKCRCDLLISFFLLEVMRIGMAERWNRNGPARPSAAGHSRVGACASDPAGPHVDTVDDETLLTKCLIQANQAVNQQKARSS
jgi:hypothetical protein